jgi:SPP1 gp7 family putative phage head morphogenesis protein
MASNPPGTNPPVEISPVQISPVQISPVQISQAFNLPPEAAIRFLDAKGYRITTDWEEAIHEEHVSAFTVAKVAKVDILRQIHVSLLDAMADGTPYRQWAEGLRPELQRLGWWGVIEDADLTGTSAPVLVGPRRLRTIYDTNLRMARATALWGRIQASKRLLPYLRYSAVLDRRTRPAHRAWHGTILPVDHPFWATHFPPCGWNCRCTVVQMGDDDLARRNLKVTAAPPIDLVPFFRKSTGTTLQVPRGIDPGFGYNPGIARAQAIADKAAASLAESAGIAGAAPAALADILAELPVAPDRATTARLNALAAAGAVAELAAALAELLGAPL